MLNGLNGTNRLLPTFIVSSAVYDEDPTVYDVEETTRELVQDQFVISPFEDTMPRIRWRHPLLAALLICICVLTILGNVLVVTAVCTKKYLRQVLKTQSIQSTQSTQSTQSIDFFLEILRVF